MTALWAGELGCYGIRSGAIAAPGFTRTPISKGMPPEAMSKKAPVPLKGEPEEMFQAIKFMIECDYFTGRCVEVDGGLRLK